jgi:hypothetical protein
MFQISWFCGLQQWLEKTILESVLSRSLMQRTLRAQLPASQLPRGGHFFAAQFAKKPTLLYGPVGTMQDQTEFSVSTILYAPELDNIAGKHEGNKLLTSDPHFGALHRPWGHAQVWDELH